MKYCDEFAPLLSAFVDGELDAAQRKAVLAHAAVCEDCHAYLGELTEMRAAFDAMEEAEVPDGFTGSVMSAVRAEKAGAKKRGLRRYFPMAACAAVIILAAAALPSLTARKTANDTSAAPENSGSMQYSITSSGADTGDSQEEVVSEQRYAQVQGSFYDTAGAPSNDGAAEDNYCKSTTSENVGLYAVNAAIGGSGEEGMLLVEDGKAPLIAVFGVGAADYLLENGAIRSEDDFYYAPIEALRELPDSFALSEGASTVIDAAPAETEWVILACLEEDPEEATQP